MIDLLKNFVEQHSLEKDLQFKELSFNLYEENKRFLSKYFLLVASIDQGSLVGKAENAGTIISYLWEKLQSQLFYLSDENRLRELLTPFYRKIQVKDFDKIPRILSSAINFINTNCSGDVYTWAKKFKEPIEIIEEIATGIYYMGYEKTSARKKCCMYLRWMVRDYPNLRVFDHLSPTKLYIPLDKNTGKVFKALGVLKNSSPTWKDVENATLWVKEKLYPDDPAKVDYPFFLLGRKLPFPNPRQSEEILSSLGKEG